MKIRFPFPWLPRLSALLAASFPVLVHSAEPPRQEVKCGNYRVSLHQKDLPVTTLYNSPGYGYERLPISYVDAIQDQPSEVVVDVGEPIRSFEWSPRLTGVSPVVKNQQLRFHLEAGSTKLAVRLNQHQWLLLFLNRPDLERPNSDAADIVSLKSYGADPTGKRLETATLQKAIDDAAAKGRPITVFVPAGVYRTGSLWMKSFVTLYLDEGAVLKGDENDASYPQVHYERQPQWDPKTDPACYASLIWFHGVHDAALRGHGVLDGQGSLRRDSWRSGPTAADKETRHQTNLVRVVDSERVRLDDVVLRDSEFWAVHLLRSREISSKNLKVVNEMIFPGWDITNPASRWNNTDGIDVDACSHVTIEDAFAYTGDDGFVLKTTNSGPTPPPPCEDVLFRRCSAAASTFACKFGTESVATAMRRITFEDLDILSMHGGNGLGILARDTATLEQITFRRGRFENDHLWLVFVVDGRSPEQKDFVKIRDIRIEGIHLPKSPNAKLLGRKDTNSLSDIRFSNITVEDKPISTLKEMGMQSVNATDISIDGKPVAAEP